MKVAIIETGGWGGISHYAYNLSEALVQHKDSEVFLITDAKYELESLKRSFRLVMIPISGQPYHKAICNIITVLFKIKPQVIHVQSLISARKDWFIFLIARLLGTKIIFTAHNILPHAEFEKKAFFMKSAYRIIYSSANQIFVHSQFSKRDLSAIFKVREEKIAFTYHGNYLFARIRKVSKSEARKSLGLPEDKRILLCFGAIRKYKGIDELLGTFQKIAQAHKNVFLLIVGKPINIDSGYYKGLIESLGLSRNVMLKSEYIPLEDIQLYFCASDVAVFPYKEIDASGSLQLAYAFAKPVVVARVGGFGEVVDNGVNGLLYDPQDSGGLSEAIENILFDDGKIAEMGRKSLKLAENKFSWEKISQAIMDSYKNLGT